ncbi:putative RNA-directed DNA polymerase [Helianthus annuus]|nr:putative RNA-directed DNA polymerase [Helianthus annuus]KAJ0574430.1 putative RNA-directed DNA polymerase [Helianthus annuus]KAJ0738766.1 putative RNA-directed DNA polymerase [Helianthus annuus]KAJ0741644.1 putative RNA-directed DNA polymerase [Helianthus annuus]KAJ0912963.1 putative RNA-directed DNA polymerase [Helianthus annuus]
MSPYLFTLVMEVLTIRLDHMVASSLNFRFHNKCDKQRIVSLCFADDLFMFARGEIKSVKLVLEALESFKNMSGLVPSIPKSTVYFANVTNQVKQRILDLVSFKEGHLPVKYLSVPLISSRLLYKDCQILVEKMENRITYWGNKFLSFAGRLQLIRSVLSSMHVYWASVFILPKRITKELERKMKDFLWKSGSVGKGKAKVAWKTICRPREEGGLGIKRVDDVNKALMTFHVWSLLTNRESLWVKWIHTYKLKQRCFWDVPIKQGNTWGWRKILKLRPIIREHVWSKIGDGMATFAWYDKWSHADPIGSFITPRMFQQAGFGINTKLAEVVNDGQWLWPEVWLDTYPALANMQIPSLTPNKKDTVAWIDNNGKETTYSSKNVWDTLRLSNPSVNWYRAVWFSQCIPRHAFLMWLVIGNKLKTQDRLKPWDVGGPVNLRLMCCPLCQHGIDSRTHLFFECPFSTQVWMIVKPMGAMQHISDKWEDIFQHLVLTSGSKLAKHVIGRILIAASVYQIWLERNSRLFASTQRSTQQVADAVNSSVRLKLVTLKFKDSRQVEKILEDWKLPKGLVIYDQLG